MTIDVTVQQNGYDLREQGGKVRLPPEVVEVRYNRKPGGAVDHVRGDRSRIAATLREHGYEVAWIDDNPAVVLGSRTSEAKAAAARRNGRKGWPRKPKR